MARYLDQRLKLRHLRVIHAISQHASLLRASQALRLTQPALTRSLQEIEEIVGVRLYDRHAKGVRETAFGGVLSQSAAVILGELSRLDATLDRLVHDTSVSVSLGVLPVAAVGVMPSVIKRLNEEHPELRISLTQGLTEELIPSLEAGRIDLIVGRLYDLPTPDTLTREIFYHEPISLMARPDHPIFDGPGPTLERLAQTRLALPTVATLLGQEIDLLLAAMRIDPASPVRSSSLDFLREMTLTSDVVSLMPQMMLANDLMRGAIRSHALPIPAPARPAGVIYRTNVPMRPAAKEVLQALKTGIRQVMDATPTGR